MRKLLPILLLCLLSVNARAALVARWLCNDNKRIHGGIMKILYTCIAFCFLVCSVYATPAVVDAETGTRTSGTSFDVAVPSNSAGNLMLAFGWAGFITSRNITPPGGWTPIINDAEYHTANSLFAWYKISSGSEGSNYTFTTTDSNTLARVAVVSISGAADPGDIALVSGSAGPTGSSGTVTSQSITATNDESLLLRAMADLYDGTPSDITSPSGHSLVIANNAVMPSVCIASKEVNAGATGTADFTYSLGWHSQFGGIVLAIAPAAEPSGLKHLPNISGNLQTLSGNLQ